MTLRRFAVWFALTAAALLACLQARAPEAATISARELLTLTQQVSQANYTFNQETSAALAGAQVPKPPETASQAALEDALRAAGFRLRPLGIPGKKVFVVERTSG